MDLKIQFSNIGEKLAYRRRQENIAQRTAQEKKLQAITQRAAREILGTKHVSVNVNTVDNSRNVSDIINDYNAKVTLVDSVWAPWSKSFRK